MSNQKDQPKHPSFAEVKAASLRNIERVLAQWLPNGKKVDRGLEYTAPNPTRADKTIGSFKVNLSKGAWSDFATGDSGGDLIDLVRYVDGCTEVEARNALAEFLNLTASESGSSTKPANETKAESWQAMQPIPDEAMRCRPGSHYRHKKPSAIWTYRDTQARPLMLVCRFDLKADGEGKRRKEFAPLTWCKSSKTGKHEWRWQGLPPQRPLLNLDKLAERPGAPVVVCEGEKAADAAASLLPDHVATCWPNGSKAWGKADFTPLKGRNVLLWPDNDQPGLTCMDALAAHLQTLGVEAVQLVAVSMLHKRPKMDKGQPAFADGGAWPEGADAADAPAQGWTAKHLAELLRSGELYALAPTPGTDGTKTVQPDAEAEAGASIQGGYRVRPDGVFYVGEDGDARQICSKLDILARTRDEKGHSWGLLVEFNDPDGDTKRWNIPARCMAGDFGKEVIGPLVDMGLSLAPNRPGRHSRNDLQSYLQAYQSSERARLVTRLGWHGDAYLMPDRQAGISREQLHFYEAGAQLPPISQAGTLDQWRKQVAALCVGNHRLAFVVSVALAGPLLHMLGYESGGFHLYGDSSGGKTTHLHAAASVWGSSRMVRSWRSTDNALESIAAAHSDGLLVLDEIGMCDPRIIGETIYMLGNGAGKARSNDRGHAGRPVQEWRLLFLSTGEKTLAQHMADAGKDLKAGMEVRMLAVPAEAGKGMGLFEQLHGQPDAATLSDTVKARSVKYYGTAAAAFLEALTKEDLTVLAAVLRHSVDRFIAEALPVSPSGQAQRAATRFGLVAIAGELATGYGITGWPDGFATQAARVCLDAWLAERGGAGNLEGDAIVERLRLIIERYGESRFTRWDSIAAKTDDHAPRTGDRLGFRRTVEHSFGDAQYTTTTYYVLPTAWRDEVFKGMNLRNVNRVLVDREIVEPGKDAKAAQALSLPGMPKTRAYVVDATKLFADAGDALAAAA
ncbi:MAG: DUF927 domain-containing protein [Pseudomonas sp.]|nr:DUF927 domain-containing protein [Pseudomonas sp.]PHR10897.1 MAG: DNA/RNA helicase, superfamily II protein [Sphingopyxis sp.]